MNVKKPAAIVLTVTAAAVSATTAHSQSAAASGAQAYPVKPVRVVIGGSPGSNADIFFRIVQARMGSALGQPMVVDYRPGAGGAIGANLTVKSVADGYAVMMVAAGFVMNPALTKSLPYDPARDFTALGLVADVPAGLVIHPSLPARDVKQLIAIARARPGQLNFGSAGPGTVSHLAGVLFNLVAKVDTVHVPYKSSGPSLVDLIAGQMAFSFPTVSGAIQHVHSGKLRLLALTGTRRSPTLKDTPTAEEAGLPGFVVNSGFGFVGPGGMPRSVVEIFNAALAKTIQDPAVRKSMIENGADPIGNTPEQHDAYLKSEVAKWLKVGRDAGIKQE
jgi:tripartite-type tricarboxylate transporter receptor subunit TctC